MLENIRGCQQKAPPSLLKGGSSGGVRRRGTTLGSGSSHLAGSGGMSLTRLWEEAVIGAEEAYAESLRLEPRGGGAQMSSGGTITIRSPSPPPPLSPLTTFGMGGSSGKNVNNKQATLGVSFASEKKGERRSSLPHAVFEEGVEEEEGGSGVGEGRGSEKKKRKLRSIVRYSRRISMRPGFSSSQNLFENNMTSNHANSGGNGGSAGGSWRRKARRKGRGKGGGDGGGGGGDGGGRELITYASSFSNVPSFPVMANYFYSCCHDDGDGGLLEGGMGLFVVCVVRYLEGLLHETGGEGDFGALMEFVMEVRKFVSYSPFSSDRGWAMVAKLLGDLEVGVGGLEVKQGREQSTTPPHQTPQTPQTPQPPPPAPLPPAQKSPPQLQIDQPSSTQAQPRRPPPIPSLPSPRSFPPPSSGSPKGALKPPLSLSLPTVSPSGSPPHPPSPNSSSSSPCLIDSNSPPPSPTRSYSSSPSLSPAPSPILSPLSPLSIWTPQMVFEKIKQILFLFFSLYSSTALPSPSPSPSSSPPTTPPSIASSSTPLTTSLPITVNSINSISTPLNDHSSSQTPSPLAINSGHISIPSSSSFPNSFPSSPSISPIPATIPPPLSFGSIPPPLSSTPPPAGAVFSLPPSSPSCLPLFSDPLLKKEFGSHLQELQSFFTSSEGNKSEAFPLFKEAMSHLFAVQKSLLGVFVEKVAEGRRREGGDEARKEAVGLMSVSFDINSHLLGAIKKGGEVGEEERKEIGGLLGEIGEKIESRNGGDGWEEIVEKEKKLLGEEEERLKKGVKYYEGLMKAAVTIFSAFSPSMSPSPTPSPSPSPSVPVPLQPHHSTIKIFRGFMKQTEESIPLLLPFFSSSSLSSSPPSSSLFSLSSLQGVVFHYSLSSFPLLFTVPLASLFEGGEEGSENTLLLVEPLLTHLTFILSNLLLLVPLCGEEREKEEERVGVLVVMRGALEVVELLVTCLFTSLSV